MIRCEDASVIHIMNHARVDLPAVSKPFVPVSLRRRRRAKPAFRDGPRMTAPKPEPDTAEGATQLMRAVAERQDRDAFASLFAHFAPRVKAYMLKLGTDGALAEELAQEALLTVWRKAAQFDRAKASPSTWIFTIARNLRIDAFRKTNRPELDPDDPALVPDPDEAADERIDRLQHADLLRAAMKELNEEQVEVVRLSFYEDKSHSAIAEELGIPLGTVKSRLRLAFGRIRKALGEDVQ